MLWFMVVMTQIVPTIRRQNDQHPEGKRHDVVGVVRAGRDVEEEDEVNAHLRDVARTTSATGMLEVQTRVVPATKNDTTVSSVASPSPSGSLPTAPVVC